MATVPGAIDVTDLASLAADIEHAGYKLLATLIVALLGELDALRPVEADLRHIVTEHADDLPLGVVSAALDHLADLDAIRPGGHTAPPDDNSAEATEAHNVLCGAVTDDVGCDALEGCPEAHCGDPDCWSCEQVDDAGER